MPTPPRPARPGVPRPARPSPPGRPSASRAQKKGPPLVVGQRVWHPQHGGGRVVSLEGVTAGVLFGAEASPRKVLLLGLVSWKARPLEARPTGAVTSSVARTAVAGGPAARPATRVAWHPVPRTLVILARERGLRVDAIDGGFAIVMSKAPQRQLVRIREDADGHHEARAAVSAHAGASRTQRDAVASVNAIIDGHLARGQELEARLALVAYLPGAERRLEQASRESPAPGRKKRGRKAAAPASSPEPPGPWERRRWPGMIRIVQGGAPGLGKRH